MINNFIKNICLIGFALIGPITLPAGGIQRELIDYKILNTSKEIILNTSYPLYAFPNTNAKKLIVLHSGSSLSILQINFLKVLIKLRGVGLKSRFWI